MGWSITEAGPEHENGLVYLWAKDFARTRAGTSSGGQHPDKAVRDRYWYSHVPIVEYCLGRSEVRVLAEDSVPGSILAFAALDRQEPDTIHYVAFKDYGVRLGLVQDMAAQLLGELQGKPLRHTWPVRTVFEPRPPGQRQSGPPAVLWERPRSWLHDPMFFARQFIAAREAA